MTAVARLAAVALLVATAAMAWLAAATAPADATGSLLNPAWTASSTTISSGTSYTFTFITATTGSLDTVKVALSASGVGGTAAVGTGSPASVAVGGAVSLTGGNILTYAFTAATISAGTAVSIQVNGLSNPGASGA